MANNVNLTQATIQALVNDIQSDNEVEVEGVVDGILVVTDPEISDADYEEVIENAQEIIEDTPEGQIPFMEDYLGYYLQTCPICGNTFVTRDILGTEDACPVCLEQPGNFVMVGKIQADEKRKDEIEQEDVDEQIDDTFSNTDTDIEINDEETVAENEEV